MVAGGRHGGELLHLAQPQAAVVAVGLHTETMQTLAGHCKDLRKAPTVRKIGTGNANNADTHTMMGAYN